MAEKKITKKEILGYIAEVAKGTDYEGIISEYVEKEFTAIDKRNAKDAERRLAKRVAGDEFQAEVQSVITPDFQTIDDVIAAYKGKFGKEPNSQQAVIAKLRNLVDGGLVVKEKVKTPEGSTKMAYRLA